jgi:hypothetical protein
MAADRRAIDGLRAVAPRRTSEIRRDHGTTTSVEAVVLSQPRPQPSPPEIRISPVASSAAV